MSTAISDVLEMMEGNSTELLSNNLDRPTTSSREDDSDSDDEWIEVDSSRKSMNVIHEMKC